VVISRDDLTMQALVWFCLVLLKVIQFGAVWFGTSYKTLSDLTYLNAKF
jgi:hypothetical protein